MNARTISPEGVETPVTPTNGRDFKLEEAQKIVGGYIEVVSSRDRKTIMIVDEEGKLKGYPLNQKATEFAHAQRMIMLDDCIVGTVLVCERKMLK